MLRQLDYRVYDWGLGTNMGYRASMKETLPARLHHIRERTDGRRVSLIGWSAGGIYARELARALPDDVRSVITLGSPFRGNHQASTAWRVWRLVNRGADATESVSERALIRRAQPLSVPTTCIYSKSDGIVAWQCCTSVPAPQTENIEVRSSHLGYGHNVQTLSVIADRLAQPEGGWQPYRRSYQAAFLAHGAASREMSGRRMLPLQTVNGVRKPFSVKRIGGWSIARAIWAAT